MKTLSVQQPWASLLVKGFKNVENRTFNTNHRGKLLIHATAKPASNNFLMEQPMEYMTEILNDRSFGNMGLSFKEYPTSAIIGWVDIVDVIAPGNECFSNWNGGEEFYRWCVGEMEEFDEPIVGVKGKLGIWEYPDIDENNFPPSHKPNLHAPNLVDDTLWVPVNETQWEMVLNDEMTEWSMFLVRDLYCMNLINEDGSLKQYKYIGFEFEDRFARFEAAKVSVDVLEDDNWLAIYPEDNQTGTAHPREYKVVLGEYIWADEEDDDNDEKTTF